MTQDDQFYKDYSGNLLNGITEDDTIYRIFSFERFFQLLRDRKLCLVNIARCWEDTFENFLYSIQLSKGDDTVSLDSLKNTVFGQSWSLLEESDAMWRIYSHDQKGVQVSVKVKDLVSALWGTGRDTRIRLYFGKVRYIGPQNINSYLAPTDVREALSAGRLRVDDTG